jgi:hypothetical protein
MATSATGTITTRPEFGTTRAAYVPTVDGLHRDAGPIMLRTREQGVGERARAVSKAVRKVRGRAAA